MWRALVAFTGNPDLASDAVSEAFAQAIAHRSGIRSPARWIWRTSYRIAAGELKERSRFVRLEEARFLGYEMPDGTKDIVVAMGSLSPNQRAVVLLHDYVGFDTRETASLVGCSAATVRVHLSNGRRRLRSLLEESV